MKRFIFILPLFILLFGCGSSKNSSKTVNSEDIRKDVHTVVQSVASNTDNSTEGIKTDIVIEEEIMEFSKPDSIGKQYTTKITKRKKHSNKQSSKQTDKKEALQQNISSVDKSKIKAKETSTVKHERKETKQVLYVGIAIGSLAILILLLWLIKRKL